MFTIQPHTKLRPSPFYDAVVGEGMVTAMPYNRMILPTSYGRPDEEYWRIINGVSMWDVGCERQVELKGPDAGRLAQILCPRNLENCAVGQGKYVALCNHDGYLLNDPILLKVADDCYWLSIADSNIWYWARAIASERRLDVVVREPDVSPLAVQGPLADEVVASLFGDWVRDLKYFWFRESVLDGIPVMVARSGWSKQGGFEIYLMDGSQGGKLWNIVKEAGQPWGIGPGAPSTAERVESGLVSVGGDTDETTNPFEVRLGRFVDVDVPDDVIGIAALRRFKADGSDRHQLGVVLDDDGTPTQPGFSWQEIRYDGRRIGDMTCCVWSPRMAKNIGYGLVASDIAAGTTVEVIRAGRPVAATLTGLPFLK